MESLRQRCLDPDPDSDPVFRRGWIRIRVFLSGWIRIRIRSISDRIRNPAPRIASCKNIPFRFFLQFCICILVTVETLIWSLSNSFIEICALIGALKCNFRPFRQTDQQTIRPTDQTISQLTYKPTDGH